MGTGGTYLDEIVADVRRRLADGTEARIAEGGSLDHAPVRSLRGAIEHARDRDLLAIVAEVKRRSPSVGVIDGDADPSSRAADYAAGGASGISVLTEPDHFAGCLDDLGAAREGAGGVPILRKDFVLDRVQLDAARACGADAVLLIAALHEPAALAALVEHAHACGMEVLLEVHDEADLARALDTPAGLIGINNRDLRSFTVDLATTERLAPLVPPDRLVVAESGVRSVADAARLRAAGADALLVGEALMRAGSARALVQELGRAGAGAGAR